MKKLYSKLQDYYYACYRWFDNLYWQAKNYLTGKRYDIVKLNRRNLYCDVDHRLQLCLEILLREYIEKEDPWNVTDWDADERHKNAAKVLKDCYQFFTVERKNWDEKIDKLSDELYSPKNTGDNFLEWLNREPSPEDEVKQKELWRIEEEYQRRQDEVYLNIVKFRKFLWT